MSNTNQPESAFPSTFRSLADPDGEQQVHRWGMELRDYFAAKAMQAILSDGSWHGHTCKTAALESYEMADAMLKVRSI
jgi:hypothetical protein